MSTAQILFEDVDGQIAVKANFDGGFDKTSNAHQHVLIVMEYLDKHLEMAGQPSINGVVQKAE